MSIVESVRADRASAALTRGHIVRLGHACQIHIAPRNRTSARCKMWLGIARRSCPAATRSPVPGMASCLIGLRFANLEKRTGHSGVRQVCAATNSLAAGTAAWAWETRPEKHVDRFVSPVDSIACSEVKEGGISSRSLELRMRGCGFSAASVAVSYLARSS